MVSGVKKASELVIPCEACGKALLPVMQKDGSRMSAAQLKEFSQKKYGKTLCAHCMKEAKHGTDSNESGLGCE